MEETIRPAQTTIGAMKRIEVTEGKKFAVQIDGVDDAELTYTVPAGKTAQIMIRISGTLG